MEAPLSFGLLELGMAPGPRPHAESLLETIDLAVHAEAAGFERFWLTEHHGHLSAQASPTLLIPVIAMRTRRLRVGTGALLLPYYVPLKVAEDFLLLETLFPGRIELGIARGPGASLKTMLALLQNQEQASRPAAYVEKARELAGILARSLPASHYANGVKPTPHDARAPPLWSMGRRPESAELAAEIGSGIAFGAFLSQAGEWRGPFARVLEAYRAAVPAASPRREILALSVLACEERGEARALHEECVERGMTPHNVVGSYDECTEEIRRIAREFSLRDVMIVASPGLRGAKLLDMVGELGARLRTSALAAPA